VVMAAGAAAPAETAAARPPGTRSK
jgi:hypothetical protein